MIIDPKSRPPLLTWLCTGSFVFGLFWIFMFLALLFFSLSGSVTSELFPGIAIEYLNAGILFIFAEILLTAFGIAGVILMWQMKKSGFYTYAIVKTITYFLPVVFIGNTHLSFTGLFLTAAMITLYGTIIVNDSKKIDKLDINNKIN